MMIDRVEEAFYVTLDHPGSASPALNFSQGSMTAPTEAETMGRVKESWLKNGFHDH